MLNKKFKLAVADVVVGAVVSLLVLAAFYMQWGESMELKLYDMRAKLRARARAGEAVVLVEAEGTAAGAYLRVDAFVPGAHHRSEHERASVRDQRR